MIKRAEVLRRQFRDPVRRDRLGHVRFFPHRQRSCLTIDGRGRCIDEAAQRFHTHGAFQQTLRCQDITIDIVSKFMSPTGAYPCLGRLVKDPFHSFEQRRQIHIQQIPFDKSEVLPRAGPLQVTLFQRARIVVDKGIDTADLMPISKQSFGQVRADKSSHTCYKTSHYSLLHFISFIEFLL